MGEWLKLNENIVNVEIKCKKNEQNLPYCEFFR